MEIESIKTNDACDHTFFACGKGVQKLGYCDGVFYDVCYIKKLWFGRYQIDYFDSFGSLQTNNQIPNTRLILYPSGICNVRYKL